MSKQLTLSATFAALSMLLLALASMHGFPAPEAASPAAHGAPLFGLTAAN